MHRRSPIKDLARVTGRTVEAGDRNPAVTIATTASSCRGSRMV